MHSYILTQWSLTFMKHIVNLLYLDLLSTKIPVPKGTTTSPDDYVCIRMTTEGQLHVFYLTECQSILRCTSWTILVQSFVICQCSSCGRPRHEESRDVAPHSSSTWACVYGGWETLGFTEGPGVPLQDFGCSAAIPHGNNNRWPAVNQSFRI